MTTGVVLHTQKLAGISGSEAHLLQPPPDLSSARLGRPLSHVARGRAGPHGSSPASCARVESRSTMYGSAPTSTPSPSGEVVVYLSRTPTPGSSTRTSSTPSVYGQLAGLPHPRPVPTLRPRSTGSTSFGKDAGSGSRIGPVGSLAHVHIAISQGLAQYLADHGRIRRGGLRDRPLRDCVRRHCWRRTCEATPGCSASAA